MLAAALVALALLSLFAVYDLATDKGDVAPGWRRTFGTVFVMAGTVVAVLIVLAFI